MNLKRTSLEPQQPTQVVIDRQSVSRRPLGASVWSPVEGREYDEPTAESDGNNHGAIGNHDAGPSPSAQMLRPLCE
jgi:hypothetical protein